MAKQQYRISTDSNGTSSYGFAYLALVNPSGSGKRFTIRSLEIFLQCLTTSATAIASLYRSSSTGVSGEDITKAGAKADSGFTIPASISVQRRATLYLSEASKLRAFDLSRRSGGVGNQNRQVFGVPVSMGKRSKRPLNGNFYTSNGFSGIVEPITINNGECISLIPDEKAATNTNPVRVSLLLAIDGKTVTYNFNANLYPGISVFSIVNNQSGSVVKIVDLSFQELGTADTPTLRIVPIGQMYDWFINDAPKKMIGVSKMNSDYPSFPGICYSDIGIIPQGVPEIAIAASSTGTPKDMNYLHTRDFWGPMYRNMLVELNHGKGAGINGAGDTWGLSYSHYYSDILVRRAGITLNQGEGIAIINSAETAVGVQAAFGGWNPLSFAMQVDVEPAVVPTVTIAAQVSLVGSEIRVYDMDNNPAGSLGTELSGTESCPTSTYEYVGESGNTIWVQIMKDGYIEFGQSIVIPEVSAYTYSVTLQQDLSA
jgi:hypothetical protein